LCHHCQNAGLPQLSLPPAPTPCSLLPYMPTSTPAPASTTMQQCGERNEAHFHSLSSIRADGWARSQHCGRAAHRPGTNTRTHTQKVIHKQALGRKYAHTLSDMHALSHTLMVHKGCPCETTKEHAKRGESCTHFTHRILYLCVCVCPKLHAQTSSCPTHQRHCVSIIHTA